MKRMFSPGSGVSLALLCVLVAMPTSQAAAATATCQAGQPRAIIQGSDPRTEADFVQSGTSWVRNTIQLNSQPGAQGSRPTASSGGVYAWTQIGGTAVTLVTGTDNQGDLYARFQAPDVAVQTPLTFRLDVSCLAPNGTLQTASDTVTVNIRNDYSENLAPDASASASPAVVQDGQTVQLIGSGTDPDGNPLTYHWTQEGGPAVTLANPNAASTSFVAPNTTGSSGATLKFRLTVSDATLSDVAEVTVNVSWVNDPPVTQLSCPLELLDLDEGEAFTLNGSASHDYEDGTALGYAWSGGPWATASSGWDGNGVLSLGSFTTSTASLTAPHLGYQQVGKFTYRLTVTDTGGLYTFSDCDVFVRDVTRPSITVPADITAEATSPGGANVGTDEGYVVSASDIVDGPLPLVNATAYFACEPAPGSLFALDSTTPVLCSAEDSAGNNAEAGFNVTVVDTTAPTITAPLSQAAEATGPGGAVVTFTATSDDIVDGIKDADCIPMSGTTFPLGDTTVSCGATDAHNNVATPVSFIVSIMDTQPPVITDVPGNQIVEATSPAGAAVGYTLPTAHDLVDGDVAVNCLPASGATFALGATTVTCDAADTHGNSTADERTSATFTVTVIDSTPPALSAMPVDQLVEATSAAGAMIGYSLPTAHDLVDGDVAVNCLPASGATFALGTTTVTCYAADTRGNGTSASFTVTVVDTTPPLLSGVPDDQLLEATSAAGASLSYAPTAVDLVAGAVPVSCAPASGTTFALDVITAVTCTAVDNFNNTASVGFTVTVRDTTGPTIAPHADVYAFATGNSQAVVTYDLPAASDLVDGSVTVTCLPASGSTFTAGATEVTCTAQDSHGNAAAPVHFDVEVGYNWRGFFAPVDNPSTVNSVKAGSAIPVKFNLGGNQGLAIFATNSPGSGPIACTATDGDAVEETVTAGGSSLQYDPVSGQYIYVWKTEKAWVGQCRVLQVKLRDGQVKSALFKFK